MSPKSINIEKWLKIGAGFITQRAIDNAQRLTNVVQAEADKEDLMHDPNTFLTSLSSGVLEDSD